MPSPNEEGSLSIDDTKSTFDDLVSVSPSRSLTFNLSSKISTSELTIKNKSDNLFLAFKIKTTKPQRYIVKKSIGILNPKEEVSYSMTLSQKDQIALRKERPREHSDRFMLQVVELVDDALFDEVNSTNVDWTDIKDPVVNKINDYIKGKELRKDAKNRQTLSSVITKDKIFRVGFENPEKMAYSTASLSADALREKISTNETAFSREEFQGKTVNGEDFKRMGKIDDAQTLRRKYDDLVSFVMGLESEKTNLKREIDNLNTEKRQLSLQREVFESKYNELREKCDPNAVADKKAKGGGYTLFHLVVGVMLAAAAARFLPK